MARGLDALGALLERDVIAGVPDEADGDEQPDDSDASRPDPHDGTRGERRREGSRRERRPGHSEVTGRLVEAQRETPPRRPGEIDLHHDGHRPRESLVDAEEHVGGDHEPPGRRQSDQQRHRQREEPSDHEQPPAAEPLGQASGDEVGERLGQPEGEHEGEDGGRRGEPEVLLAHEREHASLEPDHGADERVEGDEQAELRSVLAQPEPDVRHSVACPAPVAATVRRKPPPATRARRGKTKSASFAPRFAIWSSYHLMAREDRGSL